MQDDKPERDTVYEQQLGGRQWMVQGYMWHNKRQFVPPSDIIELADRMIVQVEIAGMKPTDLSISLHNRHLIISGHRDRQPLGHAAYHQVEIGYGEFRVEVTLPWPVSRDDVSASYRDGFLQVDLPRSPETQIRIVDVNAADAEPESN